MIKKTTVEYTFTEEGDTLIPLSSHVMRVSPNRISITSDTDCIEYVQTFGGGIWKRVGNSWHTSELFYAPASALVMLRKPGNIKLEVYY